MSDPSTTPTPRLGRRFITVWVGQSVSAIGSVLSAVGVAVFVFIETGSAAWLGLLSALASLPFLLTAPFLTLTDRYPKRTVMIAADAFAVVGPMLALALALGGRLEMWHLAVSTFLGGVGTSFQWPAMQAAVPALVTREALGRANSLQQLGPAIGIVVGPVLATPLVAWWGIQAVLAVDVLTFIVAAATTASVRFGDATDESDVVDDGSWSALWAWLGTEGRPLITLLVVVAGVNFLMAFFNVSVLVLATDLGGTARAGLLMGAVGGAMMLGSVVSAHRGVSPDRVGTFARGLMLAGTGFVVASLRPSFTLAIVGVMIAVGSIPAVMAAVATVFHEQVPTSMQGRMFGLRTSVGRSLEPIGAISGGLIVVHVANPAMREGGGLGNTVGAIIGVGDGRGAALVLVVVGLVLVAVGLWLAGSTVRHSLRQEVVEQLEPPVAVTMN